MSSGGGDMAIPTSHGVVFVLGPPGSGKGTQCERIQKEFGFVHLSAGDLLRAEQKREDSFFGQLIDGHIRNGTIVPVQVTCKLLENAMIACPTAPGFLIDGFPRNQDNLNGWQQEMSNKTHIHFVLFLSCPENICMDRCLGRGQGRTDDNDESFRKRVQTYHSQTLPIIQYYDKLKLLHTIDTQDPPDTVYEQIRHIFQKAGFHSVKD